MSRTKHRYRHYKRDPKSNLSINELIATRLQVIRTTVRSLEEDLASFIHPIKIDPKIGIDLYKELELIERVLINRVLAIVEGNRSRAAQLLGINPSTLHYKLKRME